MAKRFYVMDMDENNISDLLRSTAATVAPQGSPRSALDLQALVDETTGGIVAYILPGFDFDTVRHLEWDGEE